MMICNCTMAGTKSCLYCNNRNSLMSEYDFPLIQKYDFPNIKITIEFPQIKTYTTTSTIPYENR